MDSHLYPDYLVPPNYDSLLGKLIVWAEDRDKVGRALCVCVCGKSRLVWGVAGGCAGAGAKLIVWAEDRDKVRGWLGGGRLVWVGGRRLVWGVGGGVRAKGQSRALVAFWGPARAALFCRPECGKRGAERPIPGGQPTPHRKASDRNKPAPPPTTNPPSKRPSPACCARWTRP